MFRKPTVSSVAVLLIAAGLVGVAEPQPAAAASCSVLFDDFQYSSSSRSGPGSAPLDGRGPAVEGRGSPAPPGCRPT